jgi:hypothetical protein
MHEASFQQPQDKTDDRVDKELIEINEKGRG